VEASRRCLFADTFRVWVHGWLVQGWLVHNWLVHDWFVQSVVFIMIGERVTEPQFESIVGDGGLLSFVY